jgi:hypothetical protein
MVEDPRLFIERPQGSMQIDSLLYCVAALREMFQGRQRLLKVRHGLTVRRASDCPGPGLCV